MTFDQKLKLAKTKQMAGYSNFDIKTKNLVAFAEEYYGNTNIKKENRDGNKNGGYNYLITISLIF